MDKQQVKRIMEADIDLGTSSCKRLKRTDPLTDYDQCIICQQIGGTLHRLQESSREKLVLAMTARLDDVAFRLGDDVKCNEWLTKEPKWHPKCRNLYVNEKNYKQAERKRLDVGTGRPSSPDTPCTSGSATNIAAATRSKVPTFDPKTKCVICGNHWHKSKRPSSKVTTQNAQKSIYEQAEKLNRQDVLHRLVGDGCDMVANDICYHVTCMNKFRATRVPTGKFHEHQPYDLAFSQLVADIDDPLFRQSKGFLIKKLRDKYRDNLKALGVENAENYRSSILKDRLVQYYGDRVSIMDHSYEAGFICASSVPLGDALKMLSQLQKESDMDPKEVILQKAAKIIRADAKHCKNENKSNTSLEISFPAASQLVPDSIFTFTASLLCDKVSLGAPIMLYKSVSES